MNKELLLQNLEHVTTNFQSKLEGGILYRKYSWSAQNPFPDLVLYNIIYTDDMVRVIP